MKKEYIYIRTHRDWDTDGVCKLGRTECIPDRESTYITGEFVAGIMEIVIEVPENKSKIIEKYLRCYFSKYHVQRSGGIEFYKKELIEVIITWFEKTNIQYKVLSQTEISELTRKRRKKQNTKRLRSFITKLKLIRSKKTVIKQIILKARKHQEEVLDMISDFYEKYKIGKLIWPCGLGKTLLALFIVKKLNYKSVVIGVPSKILQKQWENEILRMFPNHKNILFVGGEGTTKPETIKLFIKNPNCKFIITTYHSCHLLANEKFDFKIGDEAHHLVGIQKEDKKIFTRFHDISSSKTLFMTATEKVCDSDNTVYSMNDKGKFGDYIDEKSVKWAIENKKITDFNLLTLKHTEEQVDEIIESLNIDGEINKELFLSAYMALESINKFPSLSHILIYTNKTINADKVQKYIDTILESNLVSFKKDEFYNKALHSKDNMKFDDEIGKFKKAPYGIISCVYIFGEGFDEPKLNGVLIAENMNSQIRIVQYILRANRLDKDKPGKISHVIIPFIDNVEWNAPTPGFEKVRSVVKQLRIVDENIEQKIHTYTLTKKTSKKKQEGNRKEDNSYTLDDNKIEEHQLKLRLRKAGSLASRKSEEQLEYDIIKARIKEFEIKRNKYEQLRNDNPAYNLPKDPETYFRSKCVWTNWYDFLGFDTKKFIQTKQEWIKFCNKKVSSLEEYKDLCKKYDKLPQHPGDFYADFTNVEYELKFKRQRRR